MLARVTLLWTGVAIAGLLVAGCGTKKGPPPTPQIALVATTAGFGDRSFNDGARAGLEACRQQAIVVVATAAPAGDVDIESKLVLFATENFDTVAGIGYGTAPALATVARRFEDTHFALIDAVVDQPNVESITFDEAQGAFLAGALAALVSKTHHVAFIGGADVPLLQRSEAGFSAGAREADPRTRVTVRYLTSFENAAAARDAAAALLARGDDILFVVAGPAGLGAIAAVRKAAHAYAIGVDSDQDAVAPGKVLTSVVKNVAGAALRVCIETVGSKSESGHVVLGLADDGIGLTDFAYTKAIVGRATIARIGRLRAAIVAGRISVPHDRAALAHFVPVPVP
jgi:basic membrane protein A